MKKTFTTIIFIGAVKFIFAQSYINFSDSNAVWTYLRCDIALLNSGTSQSCYTMYFSLSGDTVINSTIYHKMFYTSSFQTTIYYAGIREDSLKKVFILNAGETTEDLKFNFSGSIGDTMQSNPIKTITDIDSVLISGSYRGRYILSSNDTVIEGVGNLNEIIGFYIIIDAVRFNLLCLTIDTLIYQNNQYQTCDTTFSETLGINTINENYYRVYPNPFYEQTIIEFNNKRNEKYSLTLWNSFGQIMQTIENITTDKIKVERNNLTSGLYFFRLHNDKNFDIIGKLIVE
jgi:hypothetical protein